MFFNQNDLTCKQTTNTHQTFLVVMPSINEIYTQLKANCGKHEIICKHVGVPNPQGGWFTEPMMDPDYNKQVPMLRTFTIMPNQARVRMQEIAQNGWEPFELQIAPKVVKAAPKASSATKTTSTEAKPKTTRTRRKKKVNVVSNK